MRTPWGMSDSIETLANGIRRVGTPSHGGYWVPAKLVKHIPEEYRAYARARSGSDQWYEEDIAWACVAVTFPDIFDFNTDTLASAQQTIDRWITKILPEPVIA